MVITVEGMDRSQALSPRLPGVFSHRDFRLLWLAQSSSAIGDEIVTVALALFVFQLTGSAADLGFVLGARTVTLGGLLLLGGVWADRLPRHRVMVTSSLACFAIHAFLAVLILTGEVRVWQVVVLEAAFGAAEAFLRPAASGLLPQTVPEASIQQASAVTTTFISISELAGPALATTLVLGIDASAAFAVDAATFLFAAVCLARINPRTREIEEPPSRAASVWAEVRAGYREVRSRVWVWAVLISFCAAVAFAFAPWLVLGASVAQARYGHVGIFGLVSATAGVGTVAGSLVGLRWRPRHPMRVGVLVILLWPPLGILFALGVSLWIVIPLSILGGVGFALFDVWWATALAERIPPGALSRVTAYDWMVSIALLPLGYIVAGPLGDALGDSEVLAGGSAIGLVALALALCSSEVRSLQRTVDSRSDA